MKSQRQKSKQKPRVVHPNDISQFSAVIVPPVVLRKFEYVYQATLTCTLFEGQAILRCNSPYDPEAALGGQTCPGFDELAALYLSYCVTAFAWDVEMAVNGGTGVNATLCVCPASANNTSYSGTMSQLSCNPEATTSVSSVGGPAGRCRGFIDIGKFSGYGDAPVWMNPNLAAIVTAVPAANLPLFIAVNHASTSGTVQLTAKLTYYTRMSVRALQTA